MDLRSIKRVYRLIGFLSYGMPPLALNGLSPARNAIDDNQGLKIVAETRNRHLIDVGSAFRTTYVGGLREKLGEWIGTSIYTLDRDFRSLIRDSLIQRTI